MHERELSFVLKESLQMQKSLVAFPLCPFPPSNRLTILFLEVEVEEKVEDVLLSCSHLMNFVNESKVSFLWKSCSYSHNLPRLDIYLQVPFAVMGLHGLSQMSFLLLLLVYL